MTSVRLALLILMLSIALPPWSAVRAEDGYALITEAEEAYRAGDVLNAMMLAQRALAAGGLTRFQEATAYAYRGQGRLFAGRLDAAIADFEASEAAYGGNSFAYWGRSLANFLKGRDQEAWRNADEGLEYNATDIELVMLRGVAAWQLGRAEDARDDLEDAWDWNDDRGLYAAFLGAVMEEQGRMDESRRLFVASATARVPAAPELVFFAKLAKRGGDPERSRELYCIAWRSDPNNVDVMVGLGMTSPNESGC